VRSVAVYNSLFSNQSGLLVTAQLVALNGTVSWRAQQAVPWLAADGVVK
jgi:hypothetical protein